MRSARNERLRIHNVSGRSEQLILKKLKKGGFMKQIFGEKELVGKTIMQIILPKEAYNETWIKFTDNSFVVFDTEDRTEGFGYEKRIRIISEWEKDNTNEELVQLGLITKQEHKLAVEQEKINSEERQKQRDDEEKNRIEKLEKEQLSKLKTKYGA